MLITVPDRDITITAIRASGAGGQNVNKVNSAIHLRYDIPNSSLPDAYKERLLHFYDKRISKTGVLVIKAQQHRDQASNKREAFQQLFAFIERATTIRKKRTPTKRTSDSEVKRLDGKTRHSERKKSREKIRNDYSE